MTDKEMDILQDECINCGMKVRKVMNEKNIEMKLTIQRLMKCIEYKKFNQAFDIILMLAVRCEIGLPKGLALSLHDPELFAFASRMFIMGLVQKPEETE